MWQNWKPWTNTENNINFYNYTLSSAENESKLKLLATRFKCEKITYTSSGNSFVMLDYAGLQNNVNNYWLSFINGIWTFYYPNNVKIVKFKDSSDSKIITIDLDNYTISTTYSLGFDITCGLETNTNLKYITIQASEDSSVNGNGGYSWLLYCYELGLEDNNEPYYWDNKDWTPNQLKFPSIIKYSNILTEDKNDTGSAVLLPETSSSTGASNYEQDENGYCYIKDNEGNIVYNKFLNTLARKTKINNGYRINGNQSLELLSFNNNIRNNYNKQPGQYFFDDNKKQKYGDKEDKDKVNLEQNIPYFGGRPDIYPVIIYTDMYDKTVYTSEHILSLSSSGKEIYWDGNKYPLTELDQVCVYLRTPDIVTPTTEWNSSKLIFSHIEGTTYQVLPSETWNFSATINPKIIIYKIPLGSHIEINQDVLFNTSNLPISTEPLYEKIIETVTYETNPSINLNINYVSDGYYIKKIIWDKPITCHLSGQIPRVQNRNDHIMSGSLYQNLDYGADGIVYNYYVLPELQIGSILRGCVPSEFDCFPTTSAIGDSKDYYVKFKDLQKLDIHNGSGGIEKSISYNYQQHKSLSLIDCNFYFNTKITTNIRPEAIAVVIWKNGKLLENS